MSEVKVYTTTGIYDESGKYNGLLNDVVLKSDHDLAIRKLKREVELLMEALETLKSAYSVLKSEKTSLMRSLSQYLGDA